MYKYSSKELDEEIGLDWYYFGARYYDPAIGRWLSVDPQASKYPSLSTYNYCGNNPTNAIDPDGEAFNLLAGGIGAAIGGFVAGGYEVYRQMDSGKSLSEVFTGDNLQKVGASALGGAVAGGLTGLTMGSNLVVASGAGVVKTMAAGGTVSAVSNTVGGVVARELDGDNTTSGGDLKEMASDAGAGLVGGSLGAGAVNLAKKFVKESFKKTYKEVAKEAGVKITDYGSKAGAQGMAVQQNANKIISTTVGASTATGQAITDVVKDELTKEQ